MVNQTNVVNLLNLSKKLYNNNKISKNILNNSVALLQKFKQAKQDKNQSQMKRIDTISQNKYNKLKQLEKVSIKVKSVAEIEKIKQEQKEAREARELQKQKEEELEQRNKYIAGLVKKYENEYEPQLLELLPSGSKTFNVESDKLRIKALIRSCIKVLSGQKVVLKVNNTFYTLNDNNKYRLLELIEKDNIIEKAEKVSDGVLITEVLEVGYITVQVNKEKQRIIATGKDKGKTKTKSKRGGAYFPYFNNTDIDLKRYQIFTEKEADDNVEAYNDNCLIFALRNAGLEEEKLKVLKLKCNMREIPQCELKNICNELKIRIRIKQITKHKDDQKYGSEGPEYKLGLLEKHYFLNEDLNVSTYYVKHYDELKKISKQKMIDDRNILFDISKPTSDELDGRFDGNMKLFKKYVIKKLKEYIPIDLTNEINEYINGNFKSYEKIKSIIENYNNVKNFINKVKTSYVCNQDVMTSSYKIIKTMVENKDVCLKKIDNCEFILNTIYNDKVDYIDNLEYLESNCKLVEYKEKKDKIDYNNIVFFDFETYVDKKDNDKHKPYLVCGVYNNSDKVISKIGENCGLDFLNELTENTLLIAHNADYDFRFIIKHLFAINEISRNNSFMSCECKFYNAKVKKTINIKIKDSLKLINMKLSKFPECFFTKEEQKTIKKEVMPYDAYCEYNIKKQIIPKFQAYQYIKSDEDKKQFDENVKKWNIDFDESYDCIQYSKNYCIMDCQVLKKGYNVFRNWMLEVTQLDVNDIISLASLADKYLIKQGCYDGIFQLSGVPQQFIMKCVVGGRTMCCENKKMICEEIVNDFDAVSLYPSAMARLGFLKGEPKVLQTIKYEDVKKYDGYFVEIKINKVGINRKFPLLSYVDENGVRIFSNDMIGKTVYIDKIALEDAIEYQKIEFDIIKGYYFNDGFNYKIAETIKYLFNKRVEMKKAKNPIQMVYKELMNSAYGKTILKNTNTDYKYFSKKDEFENYLDYNYNYIHSYEYIDGTNENMTRVKVYKPVSDHFNRPQCGVWVLSMSKRIMNEVMCLAEDLNIQINYQDTDSMHIIDEQIKSLQEAYNKKYGKELIGSNMGQFHSDFDLKGADNIVSKKSIYLGKKSYIDVLEGVDKEGNKVNGYHTRMKGIPEKSIEHYAKMNNMEVYDVYYNLFNGSEIIFDLLCKVDEKPTECKFKKMGDKTIKSLSMFDRKVKF
jgi:hypothetical protein